MRTGIYRKNSNGHYYQFLLLARNHYSGEHAVVYIPLRIEHEWAGTIRPCWIPRGDFDMKFTYVGEGLPTPVDKS
jgi:hypothetical protein